MDMPFINDVWGEEDMFAIEGGITSGLSSPVLSSPSSPIRHLAVTKGSSSPYPPSSSAFASACIAVGSMDDPSSSTSPVSASPPASPSLVKRSLFVGSSTDGNGFQVTTHVHEAASAHDPKSDAMLDGPVVVEMDYMEEEQGEEENGIGDSKRLHGDKARQNGESEAGAAKSEPAAKNARRTTNEAGGGEGKASEDALLGASKKGAESMEVDDISRELTTARSDDGHDHQHLSSSSAPVSVPPLDAHSTTTDVRSTTVEKVESRQPQIETGETPAETLSSIHQLGATVLPPPPALPLAPQLLTTASTTPPATTSAPQVPTAAPPLAEPVAAPATPTATRSKTSAATASTKKSPTTPKAPVSKTVTLRVNTDREDFKRFASMTRDKLRQELKVRGLSVSGTKTDLYQRIVEAILVQEQRDKGVVGVVSNVKVGKVTAKGVGVKGRGKGRKQSRPDTAADENEDDIEAGKGKKSAGFVFPVPSASASASGSSSAPFTPFSPFAPPVSSGFAVPLSQGQAVMARKEAADSDLLSLDFNDEDALDIPLEESLMEELRKQEEREQKMGMGMAVGRGDDAEYRYRNEEERDDEDDSDSSDDMSSQDDEEEEDDLADDEERAVGGGGKIGSRSAVVRRSHRSHHAPKDELGETAMRRKENEEGLQEASKLTDIVLVNDKIPKHLRTDDRYYYCKHCDRAWPKTSFRNAQQFGAHCSNCARRQIRRTPSLPGTRTLGSPVVPAVDSLRRLSVGRLPQRRPDDASPSLKSSRDLSNSGTRKLAKISIQPMTLGRMKAENRGVFLWFDALPTDLIVRILSFLESSPRDLGAISASCHFFSIIAANDALWRRMFEARWGTDLASRYSGTWRERFASRVSFLKAKAALPPALPSPTAVANVSEEEAGKLKEAWNGLLADPKLKARTVEAVLAVSQAEAADATNAGAPAPAGSTHYLVQWAPADDNDSSAPEERQRWVSEETMAVAPVVTLAGCSSALLGSRKRRASDYALSRDGSSKRLRRPGGSDDDSSDSDDDGVAGFGDLNDLDRKRKRRLLEDESDDDDADDRSDDDSLLGEDSLDGLTNPMAATAAAADAQQQLLRRKFEEGPGAKEARLKRKQLLREKEERARKRRRKGRRGGQDGAGGADDASMNGANNDDVPLTKEDKERQQREFLRVLYNNRDYKPVILFFDRNA